MANGIRLRRNTLNDIIACCFVLKRLIGDPIHRSKENLGMAQASIEHLFRLLEEVELENPAAICLGYEAIDKTIEDERG